MNPPFAGQRCPAPGIRAAAGRQRRDLEIHAQKFQIALFPRFQRGIACPPNVESWMFVIEGSPFWVHGQTC